MSPRRADDQARVAQQLARSREELLALRRDESAAETTLASIRQELAIKMRLAVSLGTTWQELAGLLGMASPEAARSWAKNHAPPAAAPVGVTVAEAARRLDVSRQTIYTWVDAGRLQAVSDEQGRTRVILDE